jgi:hypothetical protein
MSKYLNGCVLTCKAWYVVRKANFGLAPKWLFTLKTNEARIGLHPNHWDTFFVCLYTEVSSWVNKYLCVGKTSVEHLFRLP